MKLYLIREKRGINATAEYDMDSGKFVVLKGSRVSPAVSSAPTFRGAKSVKKQRELYVENGYVNQDVVFKSSSTAGNFVTGNSTDGPRSWRDENGKTLKMLTVEMEG